MDPVTLPAVWHVLGGIYALVLLALVTVSVAAARGALRRNRLAGIRLPSLFRSDAAWRAGHRAAVLPGAVALVVCLACDLVGLVVPVVVVGALGALVGGLLWTGIAAVHAARATD